MSSHCIDGAPNGQAQPPLGAATMRQNTTELVRAAVGCSECWAGAW
jgi:hypothetical protein